MNQKICAVVFAMLAATAGCSASSAETDSSAKAGLDGEETDGEETDGGSTDAAAGCTPSVPPGFDNALCICSDFAHAGVLRTEAAPGEAASVGVNGTFSAASGTTIQGSLSTAGKVGLVGRLSVRDDARSASDVDGVGELAIGHDLSVGGSLRNVGNLVVGGSLAVAGKDLHIGGKSVGGSAAYVAAPAPCGCDPSTFIDVAGKVAAAKAKNDNASAGLPTTPTASVGTSAVTLPSGSYFLSSAAFVGTSKVTVTGSVSLHVEGSIAAVGAGQIELAPGATLDMYVDGSLASAGQVTLGKDASPGAFRLYVGGSDAMILHAGAQAYRGMIYAPTAKVAFAGRTAVEGSLFAHDVAYAGELLVRYSKPVATACTPPQDGSDAGAGPGSDAGDGNGNGTSPDAGGGNGNGQPPPLR